MPTIQNDSRLPVLLLIIFILWAFPDPPAAQIGNRRNTLELAIERGFREQNITNSTDYGAFQPHEGNWLNITGLRQEDGFVWDLLPKVKERATSMVQSAVGRSGSAEDEEAWKKALTGDNLGLPIWRNLSGHVRGQWVRSKLDSEIQRPTPNVTDILPWDTRDWHRPWERNVTGDTGDLKIDLNEKADAELVGGVKVQKLKAEVTLQDKASSGSGWQFVMYGTHFVESGHIVLTTTSNKFAGMWALPQLALVDRAYTALQKSVVERIDKVIKKQKSLDITSTNPYSSMIEGQIEDPYTPRCDLVMYMQQHPVLELQPDGSSLQPTTETIDSMESELRHPKGARPYTPPVVRLSALLFSPDCGFVIESKGEPDYAVIGNDFNHLVGEKWEVYLRSSINWALIYGLVLASQVYLTITQMKHASTPSTRSRVSFYTIGMLSLGDGFVGMTFLPLGMLVDSAFLSLLGTAFFAFLAVTFFDMRFLLDIWGVQTTEQRRADRQRREASIAAAPPPPPPSEAPAAHPAPLISAAGADTLPLPISSRAAISSGATPIVLPPTVTDTTESDPLTEQQRNRREMGTLYGKFYLLLLTLTFLSLHATSWPPKLRSFYVNLLAFGYMSLWIPQIYRNIMRNCRKALLYRFVIGQSVLRLAPVAYFYCLPSNVLWVKPGRRVFLVLMGWVWLQIWVLVIQDVLGPRLGIPSSWVPKAYDYHPILREDDPESLMPIGFSDPSSPTTATKPAESKAKTQQRRRHYDCAICMQDIEVVVVPARGQSEEGGMEAINSMVARRLYMLTPCRHIFHTRCLEAAMRYRLQCPVCREGLPPL